MNATNPSAMAISSVRAWMLSIALAGSSLACDKDTATTQEPVEPATPAAASTETPVATASAEDPWAPILNGAHRSAENKARDIYRHPKETLTFFGIQPTSTVVELSPGEGWFTEVLGPYLKDSGKLFVTIRDPEGPPEFYGTTQAKEFKARLAAEASVFGPVQLIIEPAKITVANGKVDKIEPLPLVLGPD